MKTRHQMIWLPLIVIITMLASLLIPSPVLAAGEPPPPPGETGPRTPPAPDNPSPPPAGENNYTVEIPITAIEAPAETPDGSADTAAIALSVGAIAQAGAVLIGPDGSLMPLAAQETIGVLGGGGAVHFKGTGPISECNAGYCYYLTISDAIAHFHLRNGYGRIYVPFGIDESTAVNVINNPADPNLNLSKLTGLTSDFYSGSNYSPRISGGLLTITNMLAGFTVDGFYIAKGIYAHDNAGTLRLQNLWVTNPNGTGIFVNNHKGNIDLYNVSVIGATGAGGYGTPTYGDGAYLDNSLGTGNITISSSTFNNNKNSGVNVITKGAALLDRVEASSNLNLMGVRLEVAKGATVKDSRFIGNLSGMGYGLYITGTGAIKLENVDARLNGWDGVYLRTNSDISVNGGLITGNTMIGLRAVSTGGSITLNNLLAKSNYEGVRADNTASLTPKKVTVNNSQFVSNTTGAAITIFSKGNITLNNIQALQNLTTQETILLDNCFLDGGTTCKGTGSVSMLNTLGPNLVTHNNNTSSSMTIISHGAVTLNGVVDDYNKSGTSIMSFYGSGTVNINKSSFSHNAFGGGLNVNSGGKIALTSVDASYNNGSAAFGASLINIGGIPTTSATITINKSIFNNNSNFGLSASSWGSLTANNISASYTSLAGAYGATLMSFKGNVTLLDTYGANQFNFNNRNGLAVYSGSDTGGKIYLRGVTASDNTNGFGMQVINENSATPKTVTLQKVRTDNNGLDGLDIFSNGSVTLNNIQANNNLNGWGVNIDNCLEDSITLKCVGSGNVSILSTLGLNSTSYNNNGMSIDTQGSVAVNGLSASYNTDIGGSYGLFINNQHQTAVQKPVTITRSSFDYNQGTGLFLLASGAVTLNGISASHNATSDGIGLEVINLSGPGKPGVNILSTLGINQFNNNASYGIFILSSGSIGLSRVAANENGSGTLVSGAYLFTQTTSSISITCSVFNHNKQYGLDVYMGSGAINLKGVSASNNLSGTDFNINRDPVAVINPIFTWTVCGK